MKVVLALVVGYLIGTKTGGEELERLGTAVKSLYDTDELAEVVTATRSQVAHVLRELASLTEGTAPKASSSSRSMMAQVRQLIGPDRQ